MKNIPYIIIGILLTYLFFTQVFTHKQKPKVEERIIYDTIFIPQQEGNFVTVKPRPIYIHDTVKVYEQIYVDSLVFIRVTDSISISGLQHQDVDYTIKPQTIRTITHISQNKPILTLSAGLGVTMPKGVIIAEIGLKNKKGLEYQLLFDSEKNVGVGITKDFFIKW